MKTIFSKSVVLSVICITLFYCCACVNPTIEKTKLSSPRNVLYQGDGLITWESNENATGYTVMINEETFYSKDNFYLFEAKTSVKYVIFVKCVGDGKYYSDSDYSKGIEVAG